MGTGVRVSVWKIGVAAIAAAAALIAGSAYAQYKWTDAAGRVIYGDNPPADAKNIQRIDARRAAQQFPVLLYTTAECSPCDAGRQLLRARGIPYGERIVSSKEDSEALAKLGYGERLPVMTVGRQVQKEFETRAWHAALDAAGYPRTGQLPRGWTPVAMPLAPRRAEAPQQAAGEVPAGGEPKKN
jgi:glutaredoxin